MNQLAEKRLLLPMPALLAGWVRIGLAEFWQQALNDESELPELLRQDAARLWRADSAPNWKLACSMFSHQWAQQRSTASNRLAHFAADHQLNLPRLFLLALIGEAESQHLVTVAVSELQAPATTARPTVHFVAALLNQLFAVDGLPDHHGDGVDALTLHDDWLVQSGLLRLNGDGPLPLRSLQMEPALWAVLCDRQQQWPGCAPLPVSDRQLLPQRVRKQLPGLATLLGKGEIGALVIRGNPGSGRALLAAELATTMGLQAMHLPMEQWPQPALLVAARYAGWLPVIRVPVGAGDTWQAPALALAVPHVLLLGMDGAIGGSDVLELELPVPDENERRQLWQQQLGDSELAHTAAATALLSGPSIVKLARNAKLRAEQAGAPLSFEHIAHARRELGAERLRLLAQPVTRQIHRDAIVFPPMVDHILNQFIARARQRESVWNGLGATLQASRNNGLRALFVGESGTGKTLAASYLATALGAPLYRVDLAAIMNKYIGESEKNLGALLDLAAAADAVLLFDEADSLFGRRNDAKQSGERYANMLTNFLLTRIENHPGIAILTTNNRDRIDAAFTRRLDVIVEFPLPGFAERLQLWQSHLGQRSPGDAMCRTLASYCDLTGGQIRNAVLTAACGDGRAMHQPISVAQLIFAIQREYQKLGRALPAQLEQLGK